MSDLSVVLVASPIGLPSVGEVFDVEYVHVMSSHGDKNFDEVVVQCTRVPFAYEEVDVLSGLKSRDSSTYTKC